MEEKNTSVLSVPLLFTGNVDDGDDCGDEKDDDNGDDGADDDDDDYDV